MTLTEEEAKTKWCPFVRALAFNEGKLVIGTGVNAGMKMRTRPDESVARCIASGCMLWMWEDSLSAQRVGRCGLGSPR